MNEYPQVAFVVKKRDIAYRVPRSRIRLTYSGIMLRILVADSWSRAISPSVGVEVMLAEFEDGLMVWGEALGTGVVANGVRSITWVFTYQPKCRR